jgi:hypothetical protein
MSEVSKAYEPQSVEDKWYQFWLDGKFFVADAKSPKPAYSIVIPPPNVTGVLTLGHVLNNTIQDILARKARMDGKEVLWLPGTDHAGIATQRWSSARSRKSGEIKHRDDLGPRKISRRSLEMEERKRRHHHPAVEKARRVVRLDARTLHDGPGIFALRATRVRGPLQKRPHLSRQAHGELVSRVAHGVVRRRSGDEGAAKGFSIISKSKW